MSGTYHKNIKDTFMWWNKIANDIVCRLDEYVWLLEDIQICNLYAVIEFYSSGNNIILLYWDPSKDKSKLLELYQERLMLYGIH